MIELTGFASVLRGISVMYWLLAVGAVGLAIWKGKTIRTKALWVGVSIAVFGILPAKAMIERAQRDAYAKEAWAYFKKKCETEAGEKIYKTFTGVKSVLVVKPLPPASEKDLFDQFWYGDPYSNATPWNMRGVWAAGRLTYDREQSGHNDKGFEFVEIKSETADGVQFQRVTLMPSSPRYTTFIISQPSSKFGVLWEDISIPEDRKYWVAGSRLRVVDLADNSIVAERIGYLIEAGFGSKSGARRPWLASRGPSTTCPSLTNGDYEDRWFILRAVRPEREN